MHVVGQVKVVDGGIDKFNLPPKMVCVFQPVFLNGVTRTVRTKQD